MIGHVWTVLCSHAVIDQDSNSVSLLDVVEQLEIGEEPTPEGGVLFSLDLMTLWARTDLDVPARGHGRVAFLSPSGELVRGPFSFDIDLSQHRRNRTKGRFQALPITGSGRHVFRVELQNENETEWHQVANIPLEVYFTPPKTTEPAAGKPE